jgi:hypothetical protein
MKFHLNQLSLNRLIIVKLRLIFLHMQNKISGEQNRLISKKTPILLKFYLEDV